MNRFQRIMGQLWSVLERSVRRFPETLCISLLFVVVAIINNRADYDAREVTEKLMAIAALGIPLSASLKLIYERYNQAVWVRVLYAVVVVVYGGLFWLGMPETLDQRFGIRYAFATAVAYFIFTLIPYALQGLNYSLYCIKLMVSFFVSYLYTLVLYLGVIAIIFAVDFLFELNVQDEVYFDTFITAVGLFGLAYFLGKVPNQDENIENYNFSPVLRVLLVAIVMPLISIYTGVLYAYFVRVVMVVGWSDSFVSELVVWYGFISVALLILIEPLRESNKFVRRFIRIYPWTMLVPLVMLMISLMIRVNAYGITVNRALVLVAWLWFLGSVVYIIVRNGRITQIPVYGFILLFSLSVLGPVNVFTIGESSQINRLNAITADTGLVVDGRIEKKPDLDEGTRIIISDLLRYLDDYRGLNKVTYLPQGFELKDMEEVFGFRMVYSHQSVDEYGRTSISYYGANDYLVTIAGYDWHGIVMPMDEEDIESTEEGISVTGNQEGIKILMDGNVIYELSVEEALMSASLPVGYSNEEDPVVVEIKESWGQAKFVFTEFNGRIDDSSLEVYHYRANVYLVLD